MARRSYLLPLFLLLGTSAILSAAPGKKDEEGDPGEWLVRTYLYPNYTLRYGFEDSDGNSLQVPSLPGPQASPEKIRKFMKESNRVLGRHPDILAISPPEGSLLLFDPKSFTLTARLPRIVHRSVEYGTLYYSRMVDDFVEMSLVVLEAPASAVRPLMDDAATTADHSGILRELEKTADVLYRGRLEVKSGERSKLEDGIERVLANPLLLGPGGKASYESAHVREGAEFQVDPVTGADGITIDVNYAFDYDYAPSAARPLPVVEVDGIDIPGAVMDSFRATISTQSTVLGGQSRILGIWKPETFLAEKPMADTLQVAFLVPRIVKLLPPMTSILAEYMNKYGEEVVPVPEPVSYPGVPDTEVPEGMERHTYVVAPEAFSPMDASGAPADPFAEPEEPSTPKFRSLADPQKEFEKAGIEFPDGSFARYDFSTFKLTVQNEVDQLELVEAYIAGGCYDMEKTLVVTSHFVEGPATVMDEALRNTSGKHDHSAEWKRLTKRDDVSILGSFLLEARSGQRSKIVAAREFTYPYPASLPDKNTADRGEPDTDPIPGTLVCRFRNEPVGVSIQVEPVLAADEFTADLKYLLQFDYALPTVSGNVTPAGSPVPLADLTTVFHRAKVSCQSVFHDGSMRLLGTWRPRGTQHFDERDVLQAVFVKVDVQRIEE